MTIEEFFAICGRCSSAASAGRSFCLILQPLAAVIFAIRAGLRDAREGLPHYFSWPCFRPAAA